MNPPHRTSAARQNYLNYYLISYLVKGKKNIEITKLYIKNYKLININILIILTY